MRPTELIATHTNTDFDAFAAMVAVHKLYPEAVVCLGNAVNRNVREFHSLYADEIETIDPGTVDLRKVRRLVLVDTLHPNRLGELGVLCGRKGVEIVVFDHHRHDEGLPDWLPPENLISSDDGSLVTLVLRIVAERGIPLTPFEATTCALGIHEDTGSLTFSTTTTRDAEALAFCMRSGADPATVERYLNTPLTAGQRATLAAALADARPVAVPGLDVLVAAVQQADYVEGVSVVAHRVMDLTHADAFFLLVEMEQRVFVTARSRAGALDVGEALKAVGGGGHQAAASAVLKDLSLDEVVRRLEEGIGGALTTGPAAEDLMTRTAAMVGAATTVDEAIVACRRLHLGGVAVSEDGALVGVAARADLEAAARHRLGHAPVKAVMSSHVSRVGPRAPASEVRRAVAQEAAGWVAVVGDPDVEPPRTGDVLGIVTRSAAVRRRGPRAHAEHLPPPVANMAGALAELRLDELFADIEAVAAGFRGVYLVGGAVRDLLLHERTIDIDIAVEGDGIEFAHELAGRLKGRVRPHAKFQTAVIVAPGAAAAEHLRVDVASTRTEFYDFPAALPKVEHASIRSDLARRDFTINAMAIDLKPEAYGALLDPFAGIDDLAARRVVVLHNLSFIEDPTRIFRALRYESRYGLRMDRRTYNLAHTCCELDLVGDLSSARLRDELVLLLGEATVEPALRRVEELGLGTSVHPRFAADETGRDLVWRGDQLWRALRLAAEAPLWRLRLVWLLRALTSDEIGDWAARMRFRRHDGEVLARALVVGQRLAALAGRGPSEAELFDAAEGEPVEALIAAMALDDSGAAYERLARYVRETRGTRLRVTGRDLLALGFPASPRLGQVLRAVLHLKLNGAVSTREEELEAARRML